MAEPKDDIPKLKTINWSLSDNGKQIVLNCVAHTGEQMNIFLKDDELTGFMGLLFKIAERSAALSAPADDKTKMLRTDPIPVTQMGTGPGKHEREAVLSIRTGLIELLFVADAGILLDTLRKYEAICRPIEKPKKN